MVLFARSAALGRATLRVSWKFLPSLPRFFDRVIIRCCVTTHRYIHAGYSEFPPELGNESKYPYVRDY